MKKIILSLVLVATLMSPVLVEAKWYNPLSWFQKSTAALSKPIVQSSAESQCPVCDKCENKTEIKVETKEVFRDNPQQSQRIKELESELALLKTGISNWEDKWKECDTAFNKMNDVANSFKSTADGYKKIVSECQGDTEKFNSLAQSFVNKCNDNIRNIGNDCKTAMNSLYSQCLSAIASKSSYIPQVNYSPQTTCRMSQDFNGGSWTMNCY